MIAKRQTWELDQPDSRMMIKSCISCPDSEGFIIDEQGDLLPQKPCCNFYPKKKAILAHFPYIPSYCPRLWAQLDEDEPGFVHCNSRYEDLEKQQLFEFLSVEAKEVIRIVLGLPIDAINKSIGFAYKVIKIGINNTWDKDKPKKNSISIYKELRQYVNSF